jgi:hypothetical protein
VRGRLVVGGLTVLAVVAVSAHFFIRHSLMISQNWVDCNEGGCSSVYYVRDQSLVNAEYLRHYCAAYDVFTSDIARDIAHAPGSMQVAFKPDPHWDPTGGGEFVSEALIPASQAIAQRAETAAEKVPRACARSLSAQYLPAGQYQAFDLELSHTGSGKLEIQEEVAIAYNGKYLVVAKAAPETGDGVAESAVECTLDGGPVTSTDADSGTATNCESNLPW